TTQNYAEIDVQLLAVLGQEHAGEVRIEDSARFLEQHFIGGLRPDHSETSRLLRKRQTGEGDRHTYHREG
ncbi:hypothetical protein HER19_33630, partial [Rhizobium sp. BGM003]|nr:hypothetical protein [Rhizobium phaseoli]